MVCIRVQLPSLFMRASCLCGTNLQRVPSSSFSSSNINILANAVRQLLAENPRQSLAATTWECSSEGHALRCNYKQHRECGDHDSTTASSSSLMCFVMLQILSCVFLFLFYRAILRLQAAASAGICSPILIMIAIDSRCFMPFILDNCSQYF